MFTGIVTHLATLTERSELGRGADGSPGLRLELLLDAPLDRAEIGDSIAVDGVCLTIVAVEARRRLSFEAIPETCRRTTLGRRKVGARLHIERALLGSEPLGGHLVQGHVEGVGTVRAVRHEGEDLRLEIGCPPSLAADLMPKGSITVDGISLTVGEISDPGATEPWFSVYLIPHTRTVTTLGAVAVGREVNLETDMLARMVRIRVDALLARRGLASEDRGAHG